MWIRNEEISRILLLLFMGQLVSFLLATGMFTASLTASLGIDAPVTLSFFSYLALTLVYGGILIYRRQKLQVYWYWYLLLGFVDVQGNFFVNKACEYSSITSVTILDCWTIAWVIVLTWLILGTRYSLWQTFGVGICLVGLGLVLLSDSGVGGSGGSRPLLGDALVIAGTFFYAMSNVGEEFCVKKKDKVEVVAMIGLFGTLISACEVAVFERKDLKSANWSAEVILIFASYAIGSFLFYTFTPMVLKMSGSTLFNLSLLTSDMWAVVFRIFFYKQKVDWLYYAAFAFVVVGLVIYSTSENDAVIVLEDSDKNQTSRLLDEEDGRSHAVLHEDIAREAMVHSYGRSLNGFAAKLLPHEAHSLSLNEKVVSVFPSTKRKLRTTRSWDFLGMPITVKRNAQVESKIIVGLLDTGIYVESKSFSDAGYGPPPLKWKGKCIKGENFTGCNNKVIGAQYFNLDGIGQPDELSPADFDGHGTHTSSTAGGVHVQHASLYGIAEGIARGGVPLARIAMYKVCWASGCQDADLLAGFDAAIADGVDILSVSIGGYAREYLHDVIAIGGFHAMKKGIFVAGAAGNDGPYFSTVENVAPWITTVAATTIDRVIDSPVKLGNGQTIHGNALNLHDMKEIHPLVSGTRAKKLNNASSTSLNASACDPESLDPNKVKGRIVFCRGQPLQNTIKTLGGIGTITTSDEYMDTAMLTSGPTTIVTISDGDIIDTYINSTKKPRAIIYKSRAIRTENYAPFVASFSSRGPESISYKILKPDIGGPGDSILAAYSELTSLTGDPTDKRIVEYNIISGTSMATPHVASAAAYIKSFHPHWSPAALRSALMTTAKHMKKKQEGGALSTGAGNIDPFGALNPGLVYDMDENSYVSFLCKHGYNDTVIALITGSIGHKCLDYLNQQGNDGLNYPSIHYQLMKENDTEISAFFQRTVTHIAEGDSKYKVTVMSPKGLSIEVQPEILQFKEAGEKKTFKVTLKGKFLKKKHWYKSGTIIWSDSKHSVKSPVLVYRPFYTT